MEIFIHPGSTYYFATKSGQLDLLYFSDEGQFHDLPDSPPQLCVWRQFTRAQTSRIYSSLLSIISRCLMSEDIPKVDLNIL